MKLISLKKINDNVILAKDIGSNIGIILLPKGAQLKQNYINRLQEWGVHSVYIQDNHTDQVEVDEELLEQTRTDVRQITADFLENMAVGQLLEPVTEKIQGTMRELLTDQNILPYLVEIKEFSENIFRYSVDVCILAVSFGTISGYDSKQLQELAVGAILIDLGKIELSTFIPEDSGLLPVRERLEFQNHPGLGSDIIQKLGSEYENSALAILQHHEQYDGTGFPNELKGEQIHEYAKIIAIADSYLSSQTHENESQRLQPPQALQYIEEHNGTRFDPDFTRIFSQKVAPLLVNQYRDPGRKGYNLPVNPESTNKQYNPVDSKHKPDSQSHFSDGGHVHSDNRRIPGSDAHPGFKHESADEGQAGRETSQEKRQRMKNELYRIQQSFLSKMNSEPVPEQVIQVTRSIIDELVSDGGIINDFITTNALNTTNGSNSFNTSDAFNDKQLFHCMSVGLLAVMTGVSLEYTVEQLKELGTGAITLELEKAELSKAGPEAFSTPDLCSILEYTRSGFERLEQRKSNLKGSAGIDSQSGAQLPCSKSEGVNSPIDLSCQSISDFAKITGLADIYSTITDRGIGGQSLMPHEVIEYIRDHGGGYFDPQLTRLFLQSVAPFLIGSFCLLNTGEKAKILKIHKDLLARPVIRVMVDSAGNKLAKPVEKDLEKDLTLFIVKTIQEDELW
jgi:HD-GYP domain-containing protein (c-di-GMP phosphodiesterase class II)